MVPGSAHKHERPLSGRRVFGGQGRNRITVTRSRRAAEVPLIGEAKVNGLAGDFAHLEKHLELNCTATKTLFGDLVTYGHAYLCIF